MEENGRKGKKMEKDNKIIERGRKEIGHVTELFTNINSWFNNNKNQLQWFSVELMITIKK